MIRYLPIFERDLNEIFDYISYRLNDPISALDLLDKIEKAIEKRLYSPLSYEPFESNRKRKYFYYRICVENFVIYYVVIDNIMEVR